MGDNFDDSEARDGSGRWTAGGGGPATTPQEAHAKMDQNAKEANTRMSREAYARRLGANKNISESDRKQHLAAYDKHDAARRASSGYNKESVNKAISNASRYQGKVSGREANAIHRLLKGRH